MTSFEAYRLYVALKKHFNSKSYDYFKYDGKVNVTHRSFERRPDQYFFHKLSKMRDAKMMLVYNLVDSDSWIGDICINEESLERYYMHKKVNQSLKREMELALSKFESITQMLSAENGMTPLIIKKFIQREVPLEILVVICDTLRTQAYWRRMVPNDPLLEKVLDIVVKYKGFMNYDKKEMKGIITKELPK